MSTSTAGAIQWKRHEAGEAARCLGCQGQVFTKVLPDSVTFLCREPQRVRAPAGGNRYLCKRCGAAHWGYTVPAGRDARPPAVAA